jgi:hypothetical protein
MVDDIMGTAMYHQIEICTCLKNLELLQPMETNLVEG